MSTADLSAIGNLLGERLSTVLGCSGFGFFWRETPADGFRIICAQTPPELPERFWEIVAAETFSVRRAANQEPITWGTGGTGELSSDLQQIFQVTAVLTVPVTDNGYTQAALAAIWHRAPHQFGETDLVLARLLGDFSRAELCRLRLGRELEKGNQRLTALSELATTMYSSLNHQVVLEKLLALATKLARADGGTIYLCDKEAGLLQPLMTNREPYREQIMAFTIPLGEGLSGKVAQTGVGQILNHAEKDETAVQVPDTPLEVESLISVPLLYAGDVIGVITLTALGGREFQSEDLELLTIFARQAADVLEMARLYKNLEQAYQQLFTAQEQMVQTEKLRALGEMAGGVAHDFNNMLGAVLGRVQLLLTQAQDEKTRLGLEQIQELTLAGARTVARLQEFTRVKTDAAFTAVDLGQVIREAIEVTKPRWRDQVQESGGFIAIENRLEPVPPVQGNAAELVEVFTNLISNAVDAMPAGGTLTFTSRLDGERVSVIVTDTGQGIPEEIKSKIFFPFFTTKGVKSTGLGLSVSYGIISRHKGTIEVDSAPGRGTTFTLTLPLSRPSGKPQPAFRQKTEPGRPLKILMVDDDENIREIFQDLLSLDNHRVKTAASGREALEYFAAEPFDVVITDLGMPGMSGWEVTAEVKKLNPQVPVLLVSGWGAQIDEKEAQAKGADLVISKPFQLNQIRAALLEVSGRATAGRQSAAMSQ